MIDHSRTRTLIVGLGSSHGDDRAGWLIARSLQLQQLLDTEVREATIPSDVLDWLEGVSRLIICDAYASQHHPQLENSISQSVLVRRWKWPSSDLASLRSASSHNFGLPQVLRLAEQLSMLPPCVTIIGVHGQCFDAFAEPSPKMEAALAAAIAEISTVLHDEQLMGAGHA